jgi:XTP/dITP diphosphohydrolase
MSRAGATGAPLHLVGLGPGSAELLTLRSWELLASGKPLKLRDAGHEAAQTVLARGFDFEVVEFTDPAAIAECVVAWAAEAAPCVYAVPGHPLEAPETPLILHRAASAGLPAVVEAALTAVDALPASDPLTGTYAAPAAMRAAVTFGRLVSVMARLRSPGGCPWDAEQTHRSLAIHLLEETHEVLDAIDRGDMVDLEEELGDLLLQFVFHAQMAAEVKAFEVGDVVEELVAKLVYRHPHVFGDVTVSGAGEVVANWEALKHAQKHRASLGEGIPRQLPGLLYAHKVQRRLSGAGLAPGGEDPARLRALVEEASSLSPGGAGEGAGPDAAEPALGELLYEVVAVARRAGVDPEGAIRRSTLRHLAEAGAPPGPRAPGRTDPA